MATPSSSVTSPSPPMAYLSHPSASQQSSSTAASDALEREQRKQAVKKFLARAEVSMVTRALRARLSYASYKATHNIPHVPLRDLEAQTQNQSQTASFNRTIAAKRKAVGSSTYYSPTATHGAGNTNPVNTRRSVHGTMLPPTSVSTRIMNSPAATPSYLAYSEVASSSRNPTQAPNLYASLLAPPSSKQARTILNASDPPVPAPTRPTPSPRTRVPKSPRDETHRPQSKARASAKTSKVPASPERRKTKRSSHDKGKRRQADMDVDADGDIDMKAAATLTSLLMHHHRPSIGSASSPRSSIDGSEAASNYSHSHFAQSSARTSTLVAPPISAASSSSTTNTEVIMRPQTPPPSTAVNVQHTTPRAAPNDNEAANLMLFLATSPSPVRPVDKDAKDLATYRALGGAAGHLRPKGRVLFPTTPTADAPPGHEDPLIASGGASHRASVPTRAGETSFNSSISSIGTDLGGGPRSGTDSHGSQTSSNSGGPPSAAPSSLLPPALLPHPSAPASPSRRKERASPKPNFGAGSVSGTLDFNIHEFINASPSPSRGPNVGHASGGQKSNLGLRADVGRKLFEEEQLRHAQVLQTGKRPEERTLGAGIDLVHS